MTRLRVPGKGKGCCGGVTGLWVSLERLLHQDLHLARDTAPALGCGRRPAQGASEDHTQMGQRHFPKVQNHGLNRHQTVPLQDCPRQAPASQSNAAGNSPGWSFPRPNSPSPPQVPSRYPEAQPPDGDRGTPPVTRPPPPPARPRAAAPRPSLADALGQGSLPAEAGPALRALGSLRAGLLQALALSVDGDPGGLQSGALGTGWRGGPPGRQPPRPSAGRTQLPTRRSPPCGRRPPPPPGGG